MKVTKSVCTRRRVTRHFQPAGTIRVGKGAPIFAGREREAVSSPTHLSCKKRKGQLKLAPIHSFLFFIHFFILVYSESDFCGFMESLPVLDYGGTRRDALIARILEVMEDIGFLYLDNIPGYNEDELRWCVNFFYGLPLEKRMEIGRRKYNPQNENVSLV